MDNSASVVYQSGQSVPLTGQYELAGVDLKPDGTTGEKIVCDLHAHDLFPDYEGRACAWHPLLLSTARVLVTGVLEMDNYSNWEPALDPQDLARFFVLRANAGDIEGLVALYESDAVLSTSNQWCGSLE